MALARSSRGSYNVSGDATLTLRWSNISGRATDDTLTLTKKNIGGWGSINMGSGTDTVTLAAEGDYTLQLVGVETIKTTEAHTTLRFRSDATTSTDGSFESITAMYGVQNVTYTAATGTHSTLSLGELTDKATFSGSATNWVYNKGADSTVYAYDLTTGYRVAVSSDVETLNFAETDLLASSEIESLKLYLTESGTSDISGLSIQGSPTAVQFTTGNDNLVATAAQLSSPTSFNGLAGTDQITLSAAGTFNTTGVTLTSIESINGSSGADILTVTTAGITINGNADADTITGSTGNDTINGGTGADSIVGGTGNDSISGGDDGDTIVMSTNLTTNDTIDGGDGSDTLTFTDGDSANSDLNNVTNIETITLGDAVTSVTAVAGLVGATATLTVSGAALTGTNTLTWNGGSVVGGGKFVITGGAGGDSITGGSGADTISGGNGADSLVGGAGADSLVGGSGADTITGGGGADIIDGGASADLYDLAGAGSMMTDFDFVTVTNGDTFDGAFDSISAPISATGGTQVLTDLVSVADVMTALKEKIVGGGVSLANSSFLVTITDSQLTGGTDYGGTYLVSEYIGSSIDLDSADTVVKLIGGAASIAFSGDNIVVTV